MPTKSVAYKDYFFTDLQFYFITNH